MKDVNISVSTWNSYLKKYKKKYRCFIDEIGIWSIKCQYGFIQPYSIVDEQLVAVLTYKSAKGVNILLKRLHSETDAAFRIVQRGNQDISIAFDEKNLSEFALLLRIRYVRQISKEQRKILIERLKKARSIKASI